MKKLLITLALFTVTYGVNAQVNVNNATGCTVNVSAHGVDRISGTVYYAFGVSTPGPASMTISPYTATPANIEWEWGTANTQPNTLHLRDGGDIGDVAAPCSCWAPTVLFYVPGCAASVTATWNTVGSATTAGPIMITIN